MLDDFCFLTSIKFQFSLCLQLQIKDSSLLRILRLVSCLQLIDVCRSHTFSLTDNLLLVCGGFAYCWRSFARDNNYNPLYCIAQWICLLVFMFFIKVESCPCSRNNRLSKLWLNFGVMTDNSYLSTFSSLVFMYLIYFEYYVSFYLNLFTHL